MITYILSSTLQSVTTTEEHENAIRDEILALGDIRDDLKDVALTLDNKDISNTFYTEVETLEDLQFAMKECINNLSKLFEGYKVLKEREAK